MKRLLVCLACGLLYFAVFLAYNVKTTPTKFIYFNF